MSSPQHQSDKPLTPQRAWLPLTPRGIAAFAHATLTRLFIFQLIFAAIVAAAVIWFLHVAWFPVATDAAHRLPEAGDIRAGELDFRGESPKRLAENARLAIVVDVTGAGALGEAADLEITFEKRGFAICGTLGCLERAYSDKYVISFNRPEVEPAWGAWQWPLSALAGFATILCLLVMWWIVALFYVALTKLAVFFADRKATWGGAWRLSAAALLPGALIVACGLVLYGAGVIDLFRFAFLYLLHLVAGLVFIITSPFFLPVVPALKGGPNPFGTSTGGDTGVRAAKKKTPASPFSRQQKD